MQIDIIFITILDIVLFVLRKSKETPTIVFLVFPMIMVVIMVQDCKLTTLSMLCLIVTDIIGLICIEADKKGKK